LQGSYSHYWADMEMHYNFFNPDDQVAHWLADYIQQHNGFTFGLTRAHPAFDGGFGHINTVYDSGYYNFRLRAGQIPEFLLGFYGRLAFGMSRYTYLSSEGAPLIRYNTADGGFVGADYSLPNSASNADTLLMLRNALVMEELKENAETGKLFLLKGAPRAWLQPGKRIRVERLPTYFGNISFSVESRSANRVSAAIEPPKGKWQTLEISFRHPNATPIRKVTINGAGHAAFDSAGTVRLSHGAAPVSVEVYY